MFGYITCEKAEMKMRDFEVYNGYYCGVCHSIGRRWGQLPRVVLTYDAAFLALLLAGLEDLPADVAMDLPRVEADFFWRKPKMERSKDRDGDYAITRQRCLRYVGKEKTVIKEPAVDYAADVMILMAYYKAADDVLDAGGDQKDTLRGGAIKKALGPAFKKIEKEQPALAAVIKEQMKRQHRLEKEYRILAELPSWAKEEAGPLAVGSILDRSAEPTAKMLEAVLTEWIVRGRKKESLAEEAKGELLSETGKKEFPAEEEKGERLSETGKKESMDEEAKGDSLTEEAIQAAAQERVLAQLGYHLGRWIYLVDAADDLRADMEKGSYNPFLYRFAYQAPTFPEDFGRQIVTDVERILLGCLEEVSRATDLLEIKRNQAIIKNVVQMGLLRQTDRVLQKLSPQSE